jgi:hypothetical protein
MKSSFSLRQFGERVYCTTPAKPDALLFRNFDASPRARLLSIVPGYFLVSQIIAQWNTGPISVNKIAFQGARKKRVKVMSVQQRVWTAPAIEPCIGRARTRKDNWR